MNIDLIYDLYRNLHDDKLSFIYQGNFDDDITDRIIDISETNIQSQNEQNTLSRKVSFLLAECFQNIVRHGDVKALHMVADEKSGIFITRNIGRSYFITSANLILNKEIKNLKIKLDQINNLSKEELKNMYIKVLSNSKFSSRGGAGLGLIEMARKSSQKLEFDFEKIDDTYSYFYLQIQLLTPFEIQENNNNGIINVAVAKEFHHIMAENNIILIHKGDYSQHTIIPILRMIEDNMQNKTERNALRKKIFHLLVEILQNVSIHGLYLNGSKEGIFIMGVNENSQHICTGNFILNENIPFLSTHIDKINKLNKAQLVELYKTTLELGASGEPGNTGLGLIDIARDASEKLTYKFIPVNQEVSFYALGVSV